MYHARFHVMRVCLRPCRPRRVTSLLFGRYRQQQEQQLKQQQPLAVRKTACVRHPWIRATRPGADAGERFCELAFLLSVVSHAAATCPRFLLRTPTSILLVEYVQASWWISACGQRDVVVERRLDAGPSRHNLSIAILFRCQHARCAVARGDRPPPSATPAADADADSDADSDQDAAGVVATERRGVSLRSRPSHALDAPSGERIPQLGLLFALHCHSGLRSCASVHPWIGTCELRRGSDDDGILSACIRVHGMGGPQLPSRMYSGP